ncbi:MAG TPA: hypothetical protein VFS67_35550 [Polyangiaceae bacterium]|nr:hypothetical protein [Polyangiaceae bacterium]
MHPAERSQLDRLVASLGPKAASRALGVDEETLDRARAGHDLNAATTRQIRQSGWLLPADPNGPNP